MKTEKEYWEEEIKRIKKLNNKQLVDKINYRYSNGLNDDDYIAELVRRRKESGNKIATVIGEEFIMINKEKK
tara:strand:- start:189 stop:404 length:216 start_codon:yes stop_codon:yes gene_type:complete